MRRTQSLLVWPALLLVIAGCQRKSQHQGGAPTDGSAAATNSATPGPLVAPKHGLAVRIRGGQQVASVSLPSAPLSLALGKDQLTPESVLAYHLDDQRAVFLLISWMKTSCDDLRENPPFTLPLSKRDRNVAYVQLFQEKSGWRVLESYAPAFVQGADRAKVQVVSGDVVPGSTLTARVDLRLETSEKPPRTLVARGEVKATGCGRISSGALLQPREQSSNVQYNGTDLGLRGAVLRRDGKKLELVLATGASSCQFPWGASDADVVFELTPDGKGVSSAMFGGALFHDSISKEYALDPAPFHVEVRGPIDGDGVVQIGLSGSDRVHEHELALAGTISAQRCKK